MPQTAGWGLNLRQTESPPRPFYFCSSMPITRARKAEVIKLVREKIAPSPFVVFVNFSGLGGTEMAVLRQVLRRQDIGLAVVKKSLFRKAVADALIGGDLPELPGELAVAYLGSAGSDDVTSLARVVFRFVPKAAGAIKILGGIWNGEYLSGETMNRLAAIPPRQTLYGQLTGMLQAPLRRLASVLRETVKVKIVS